MPLATRDSHRIHWQREGDGDAIVLIPGTGAGARQFGTLPRRFARAGFSCLTLSPVGIEPSSALDGPYDFDDAARDLLAVLDDAGVATCTAVGTSLGGKVALAAAARAPERLTRLALLASSAVMTARAQRVYRFFEIIATRLESEEIAEVVAPFLFGHGFQRARPELVADIVRGMRPSAAARGLMAAQARALQGFDGAALARSVHCPTLCVGGLEDVLTPAAEVRATAELLPRGEFLEVPAGHSLLLESARVFEAVVGFAGRA